MNLSFKIELYYSGKKSTLYTIRINGEKENEFDKFLNNPEIKSSPEFGQVLQRIKDIAAGSTCLKKKKASHQMLLLQ